MQKNFEMEIGHKVRIDEDEDSQGRIDDRWGAQARKAHITDGLGT